MHRCRSAEEGPALCSCLPGYCNWPDKILVMRSVKVEIGISILGQGSASSPKRTEGGWRAAEASAAPRGAAQTADREECSDQRTLYFLNQFVISPQAASAASLR